VSHSRVPRIRWSTLERCGLLAPGEYLTNRASNPAQPEVVCAGTAMSTFSKSSTEAALAPRIWEAHHE
jgi:hypothetical protein